MNELERFLNWLVLQSRIVWLRVKLQFEIAWIIAQESGRYVAWLFARASVKLKLFILGRSLAVWSHFHSKKHDGWPARASERIYNALQKRFIHEDC